MARVFLSCDYYCEAAGDVALVRVRDHYCVAAGDVVLVRVRDHYCEAAGDVALVRVHVGQNMSCLHSLAIY